MRELGFKPKNIYFREAFFFFFLKLGNRTKRLNVAPNYLISLLNKKGLIRSFTAGPCLNTPST